MDYKNSGSKLKHGILGLRNKKKSLVKLGTAIGLAAAIFYPSVKNSDNNSIGASLVPMDVLMEEQIGAFPIVVPTLKYGFTLDTFQVEEGKVQKNQTFGTMLAEQGLDMLSIETLVQHSKGVFNLNRLRLGQDFLLLKDRKTGKPKHLVFEPSALEYVVFNLDNELTVQRVEHEVDVELRSVTGEINSSLWAALTENEVDPEAAAKMEDALECYVDFSHTQEGDKFKLLYEEKYVNNKSVGAGQVYAAQYQRDGKDHYAFYFDDGQTKGFYDYEGASAKKGFLKSPLKFTRISSNFNYKRFHPILKQVRPHLGTDYAAPHGTPIYSIGDGVVEEAAYGKGNGNYVKIKHDKTYQTQYLHMSRFAKGIRRGTKVTQGQVIGYVGSTGLATGPHVCFRFWKNGKQVNHLKERLPVSRKMSKEKLDEFFQLRDNYLMMMEKEGLIDNGKFHQLRQQDTILSDGSAAP